MSVHTVILSLIGVSVLAGENLVPNGSLDEGETGARHWEMANGLTSFFENEAGHGRIVKLDTAVDRHQALAWDKAFKTDPTQRPPAKKLIAPGSYSSIGGNEGVMLDSALFECKPGQNYRLSVDFKGEGKPFVWIKGFQRHPVRKTYTDGYQTRLEPDSPSRTEWRTFSIGFNPTARSPKIEKIKIRLYAYWPNGLYYFDNIRVEAITETEMAELIRKRDTTR